MMTAAATRIAGRIHLLVVCCFCVFFGLTDLFDIIPHSTQIRCKFYPGVTFSVQISQGFNAADQAVHQAWLRDGMPRVRDHLEG